MAFTEDKAVAVRIVYLVGADVHLFVVQVDQDVGNAEVAANVARSGVVNQIDDIFTDINCFCAKIHFYSPLKYALTSSSMGS